MWSGNLNVRAGPIREGIQTYDYLVRVLGTYHLYEELVQSPEREMNKE